MISTVRIPRSAVTAWNCMPPLHDMRRQSVCVEHDKPVALASGWDSVGILGVTNFWQRVPSP